MSLSDSTTLGVARDWLRKRVDDGERCPLCTQMAKVYRRKIHATMARTLIVMYLHGGAVDFVHTPSLPGDTHECSQLSWWGLIEEEKTTRPDGGRAGWWRLTAYGRSFVLGQSRVPKYAKIYDSRVLGLDPTETVSIKDVLGTKFSYEELMAGV